MLPSQKQQLIELLAQTVQSICQAADAPQLTPTIALERPKVAAHGDVACNVAMQLAKPLKKIPRELAQQIVDTVLAVPAAQGLLAKAEVAGPGFINLTLTAAARAAVVATVLQQGQNFGHGQSGVGHQLMVEFVSANPTGPLHVGHGRQGALGDALSALFESQGWKVVREFYYNDAGVQIHNLAISVQARGREQLGQGIEFPENGYQGEYIRDIARDLIAQQGAAAIEDMEAVRTFAVAYLRREQDKDLKAFGVAFDNYYLESSLYTDGKVESAVQTLVKAGKTFEEGGALWLRTTEDGDDKDRVMKKSDGSYTYFVPDVAYHTTKWQRGFDKVINVQGSDHHGTIARVRSGLQGVAQANGWPIPKDYPSYVLHKMVTVMKGGEEVKISKRAGSYVTLRDLIEWSGGGDEVKGRDAVRFFLISRKADTEFVFDVDLALSQSEDNPVYYVQYAHARICSVLRNAQEQLGLDEAALQSTLLNADLTLLDSERAVALMQRLAAFPELLVSACQDLAPHSVAFYLKDLAGDFHSFYNTDRVLVDDAALRTARLALLAATRQVIANGLTLLGVSAPQKM